MFHSSQLRKCATVLLIAGLAIGCSDSEPTDSQIKNEVSRVSKNTLILCDLYSISNYQKKNGIAQSDGTYVAYVHFDVTSHPTQKNKSTYQEYVSLHNPLESEYKSINFDYRTGTGPQTSEERALSARKDAVGAEMRKVENDYMSKMKADWQSVCKHNPNFISGVTFDFLGLEQVTSYDTHFGFIKTDNGWLISE